MNTCLFCHSNGPFSKPEHIIPEALGNDDLILFDEVCDKCNQYFGSKIENFVLGKTPIAFWRTFLGIQKKKGKLPHVNLSQPKKQKGRLSSIHKIHDNFVGFTCHDDYSISVDIDDSNIIRDIIAGTQKEFKFVFTPYVLSMMGRFFCKIGIELLCLNDRKHARSHFFDQARNFARNGNGIDLWPIFHGQSGTIQVLKKRSMDNEGLKEEVFCYHYQLLELDSGYTLLVLTIGTDVWIISLNDPYPKPVICDAFPDNKIKLIWYTPEEVEKSSGNRGTHT
ncbi:MAG: hypothetical protein JW849_04420 [Phycisphaerae bacterium]|nr:hypothetical protein [Phycisphaerae bacterium]